MHVLARGVVCAVALLSSMYAQAQSPIRVTARLLGVDGEPVVSEKVGVLFLARSLTTGFLHTTDAEGKLEFSIPGGGAGVLRIHRRGYHMGHPKKPARGAYRAKLDAIRKKPALGDVRLSRPPLLAAGRVVDDAGQPVGGVRVTVPLDFGRWRGRRDKHFQGEKEYFATRAGTTLDGRFELRGFTEGSKTIDATFQCEGYVKSGRETLGFGTKGHEIVMAQVSKVHGRFVGLRGMAHFPGSIQFDRADQEAVVNRDPGFVPIREDGSFELQQRPGKYTLRIYRPGEREPFHVVKDIVVHRGKPCRDPRLGGLDLTRHMRIVTLKIVGANEKPVRDVMCGYHVTLDAGNHSFFYYSDQAGVVRIPVPLSGGRVSLFDQTGVHRVVRFDNLKRDQTVKLKTGWPVRLRIKNLPALPEGLVLRAKVVYEGDVSRPDFGCGGESIRRFTIDRTGRSLLVVMDPGKFMIHVSAHARAADGTPGQMLPGEFEFAIDVAVEDDSALEVVLSDEQLQKIAALEWK